MLDFMDTSTAIRGVAVAAWLSVFIGVAVPGKAQNFKPFTPLRLIRTRHFEIIYSERSAPTALALAGFADDTYQQVSGLLGIEIPGRIPVTITPDTDRFNGYFNPFPYPHILLFDTPMDPEWTTFSHSLKGLFIHELTHALSLASRGRVFDFMHDVFGSWVMPTGLTAPLFMVEGVTVSFESLDGFGRTNDPLVRERIRQAIHEGRLLTPFQAGGVYDLPPQGNAWYEYGGLFSAYLQKKYGMERYARLWQTMGKRVPLSLRYYRNGFYRIFKDTYGLEVTEAWADFAAELALAGLEDNPAAPVWGRQAGIAATAAAGGLVYVLDAVNGKLDAVDPATGTARTVLGVDATAYDLDVSADGERLLVAGYRYKGALAAAVVTEYSARTGRPTGKTWSGLYKARYFRDGVVGVAPDLHANRLVYRAVDGGERTLLRGSATLLFSNPAPVDDNRIAFLAAENGSRRLGLYDFDARTAVMAASDPQRWRYARDLRIAEGRAYFVYNDDDGMYKLGIADLTSSDPADARAYFAGRDFSGGVFAPVAVGNRVYYRAAYSTWDALVPYPEPVPSRSDDWTPLAWESWTSADPEAGEKLDATTTDPAPPPERRYSPLRYLNPLRFWIPLPLIRSDADEVRIDGGGVLTFMSDPTDTHTFLIDAGGDLVGEMGYFDVTWASLGFGLPLQVNLSDRVESTGLLSADSYRATRASAALLFNRGIGNERLRLSLTPFAALALFADNPQDDSGAYSWVYRPPVYSLGAGLGFSTLEKLPWQLFGNGAALAFSLRSTLDAYEPRVDVVFRSAFQPRAPLRFSAYAAADATGMALDGSADRYGPAAFADVAAAEYLAETSADLPWVAGGELELQLFSLEIQSNLSHLYFNRLFGTLAYRGVVYEDDLKEEFRSLQALQARAGFVVSALPAAMVPVRFSPYVWGSLKLSDLDDGDRANDYQWGIAFSLEW